jgi:cyclophilin family peptidyl-prolyl cis-trans isomerase
LSLDEMKGKQAVLDTSVGTIIMDLLPEAAPNHVGYFIKLAREGSFNGTTFHRLIKYGIVQGGDPISRDPAKRDAYGTGGLGVLKAEVGGEKHVRGTVSSVILPGKPDTGGSQFFICVVDQPALDGQYTLRPRRRGHARRRALHPRGVPRARRRVPRRRGARRRGDAGVGARVVVS